MKSLITTTLLIFLFLLSGCASPGSSLKENTPDKVLEKQKNKAALSGINWLISKKDHMPTEAAVSNFKKIYKTTADKRLAKKLAELIKEKEAALTDHHTSIDIGDEKYRNWFELRPVVEKLLWKKCSREEYRTDTAKIQKLLRSSWNDIFPQKMILGQRLVAAYLLRELGACTDKFYTTVVSRIRSRSKLLEDPSKYSYFFYLYALTHIIFTESDYYSHYLNPEKFGYEIKGFNTALDRFSAYPELSDNITDILSEILICFKLLRIAPSSKRTAACQTIISRQNPDGSWGGEKETEEAKIHHTVVASLALLEFTPIFRAGKIYCDLN